MSFYSRSLRLKILVPISCITILTFGILAATNSLWHRQTTTDIINQSATRISATLLSAIEEPMSVGDNEGTERQLRKVAENFPDVSVFLTNFRGNVTYSTIPETLRRNLDELRPEPELGGLLAASLGSETHSGVLATVDGKPCFVAVNSIPNEKSCHHCHGASQPILGAMVLVQDVSAQFADLHASERMSFGISIAGAIFLLLALLGFLKRMILNKVSCIADISDRIRKGDYEAEFDTCGEDELAVLSENLREMVRTVQNQLQYNRGILEGIIIPLVVTDERERVTYINDPMLNILGIDRSGATRQSFPQLFDGCEALRGDAVRRLIADGASRNGETSVMRADGEPVSVRYEISALRDATGAAVGAIAMMIDLTKQEEDKARIRAQRENLLQVADQVTSVSTSLSDAAADLTRQMEELTRGMEETAGQTSQVAAAMEEMNATVLEVAKNAGTASDASNTARDVAKDGGNEVGNTVQETRQMAETTLGLAKTLGDLSEKAENIGQVMSVINDIADQTNLLALNAAIEAARAGDAGRGFAVVADEVRKLAEKTMTATQEVHHAIRAIQHSAQEAVAEMNHTRERAHHTEELAENAGNVLTNIVSRSESIADMVRSIATAADQQSSTSEEINLNLSTINQLSQDISQRITQANSSIRDVAGMAERLNRLVDKFRE
ncbi:methyl-accepting chemotaxis protein [Desulfobaculum xiamenense]|uniref:Methyl-accepting chemotaxis protein n=1 Tax=Desulfobaculum xiamenense TaxID=995050 RepID=A0A846QMC0_9BACT|nr:methyl-accepting chemotaxis protein [Desulfobaculum xiamenense]NJB68170.1 methyl-accepting chemotaxis protein [Desulfobaculum xiamenense]